MDYLNSKVNVNLNNPREVEKNLENLFILSIFQTFSNSIYSNYPLEDFCYFKDYPYERLAMLHLKPNYKSTCSCTELFLIQYFIKRNSDIFYYQDQLISNYYFLSQYYSNDINEIDFSNCNNSSVEKSFVYCNFKTRLNDCNVKGINVTADKLDWYMSGD